MKTSVFEKKGVLIVILIAIYIAGIALGLFAVGYYPIYRKQREPMVTGAHSIASMTPGEMNLVFSADSTSRVLRYDSSGRCIMAITPDDHSPDSYLTYKKLADHYLPEIFKGKEVFAIIPAQHRTRSFLQYWCMAGVPVAEGEGITGAVLLVRNLENIQESVMGFLIYFTVLYWLSSYFIIKYIRKRRKLEEVQQNYIANVTHSLKTPIATVKIIAETLSDLDGLDDTQKRMYYGQIINETNIQNHMVQEMLDLAKIQSRQMDLSKEKVKADDLFSPILEKYRVICECGGIHFSVPDNYDQVPLLSANISCIRQVLDNLIANAIKYTTEEGHVCFEVASVTKSSVLFCVKDDGIGIDPGDLPHIFERFYRCSNTTNKAGSGLGLAIAKEMMDGLKEQLYAESLPDHGTSFFFSVKRHG